MQTSMCFFFQIKYFLKHNIYYLNEERVSLSGPFRLGKTSNIRIFSTGIFLRIFTKSLFSRLFGKFNNVFLKHVNPS